MNLLVYGIFIKIIASSLSREKNPTTVFLTPRYIGNQIHLLLRHCKSRPYRAHIVHTNWSLFVCIWIPGQFGLLVPFQRYKKVSSVHDGLV